MLPNKVSGRKSFVFGSLQLKVYGINTEKFYIHFLIYDLLSKFGKTTGTPFGRYVG